MAEIAYPAEPFPFGAFVQGRVQARFTGLAPWPDLPTTDQDYRVANRTTGTITDQVVVKASGIDVPFENGRVWLLRVADGYKAWEGWSDAAGNYTATGLELGVAYIPVAIDPSGVHKATAAGPVIAQ